jgi:tetratricopeptide (TPR) repeat protein
VDEQAAGSDGTEVRNDLSGSVSGPVVQARSVGEVHFHSGDDYEPVVPSQLPLARRFVARSAELTLLRQWRSEQSDRPLLVVLTGPAGVGKSALALRWLQELRDEFQDGQLFVDLGGAGGVSPVAPAEVLEWFLGSLGVPPKKLPESAQLASLYRSITSTRQLAVLLDDARTAAQVRAVLPAGSQNLVVVTSRSRLSGLAMDGARWVDVEPLDEPDSLAVLQDMVGADRVAGEPEQARALVRLCGGLPLALAVVGARLSTRPHRSFHREVTELAGEGRLLAGLTLAEGTSVEAVLDAAYADLDEASRQLYRTCSGHPGREFGVPAAAAALGWDEQRTARTVDTLVEANLVTEVADRRFAYHDLLRAHAQRRGQDEDGADDTVLRFADWYLRRTVAADLIIHEFRPRLGPLYEPRNRPEESFADAQHALGWLENERANLRTLMDVVWQRRWYELAWQICEALWGFFLHTRRYGDWIAMHHIGIASATRLGDQRAEARLRSQLGFAYAKLNQFDNAEEQNLTALRLAEAAGDGQAHATALSQLGRVARGRGDLPAALRYFRESRDIQARLEQWRGVALCRRRIGDLLTQLGELDAAATELRAAATTMAELGDRTQHARTLQFLATAHRHAGRRDLANTVLLEALSEMRALGSPFYQAEILSQLGALAEESGDLESAYRNYAEAGDLYAGAEDPKAEVMRSRLSLLPRPPAD